MVEMRLQGDDVDVIAAAVRRSTRTVRRFLAAVGDELERRLIESRSPEEKGLLSFSDVVLHRQLGQGGMGKVYRASWRGSETPVAVKLLRKPLRAYESAATRFREEASLLTQLRHPGIVAVHGVGLLPDGGRFLVMDLVDGRDLAHTPTPPIDLALRWVTEAADALDYAHGMGVVHCDLKPSNLLLGVDGHVRVGDFGLATSLKSNDTPQGGTVGFMAPEQNSPNGRVSPQTDVYGLGAVLCSLIPQRTPELDALCRRCLAANPTKRFSSAAELAVALRELQAAN
jgi:serine/threonine protein kinase